jgi:Cu/Ag efflux pump CusA
MEVLTRVYVRLLAGAMNHRFLTIAASVLILGVALGSLFYIGTEFMPKLDEGSILVETRKLPGIGLTGILYQFVREYSEGFERDGGVGQGPAFEALAPHQH